MLNKYIDIINFLSTFSCIIPLIIYWNNKKTIGEEFKLISIYLIFCLITESILTYAYLNSIRIKNVGVTFVFIEQIIFSLYFWNLFEKIFKRILLVLIFLTFVFYCIKIIDTNSISINLFFGGTKVILILIGLNIVLRSFLITIPKWKQIFNYSILQYSILGIAVSAFADFFIANKQYIDTYNVVNSLNNFSFYLIISFSMIVCKNQYSQALL